MLLVQLLRRTIEVENDLTKLPAVQWLEEDWSDCHDQVVEMQDTLCRLGVVRLICVLLGYRCASSFALGRFAWSGLWRPWLPSMFVFAAMYVVG